MNEVNRLIKEIESQLVEVKYHVDGSQYNSAEIKSEFVKDAAVQLNDLLKQFTDDGTPKIELNRNLRQGMFRKLGNDWPIVKEKLKEISKGTGFSEESIESFMRGRISGLSGDDIAVLTIYIGLDPKDYLEDYFNGRTM
jgi:hypothetical protein